eukprot:1159936-Pelagomonas_calceolata.AAC.6
MAACMRYWTSSRMGWAPTCPSQQRSVTKTQQVEARPPPTLQLAHHVVHSGVRFRTHKDGGTAGLFCGWWLEALEQELNNDVRLQQEA